MTKNSQIASMILGEVASSGVARGPALVCACAEHATGPRRVVSETEAQKEMEKLDAAISEVEMELLDLQKKVQQRVGKEEAAIFEAQILLLHDPSLREEISTRCLIGKINIETAVDEAIEKMASLFIQIEDRYFRERAADVRDVGKRLLDNLTKSQSPGIPTLSGGSVIVTSELLPSVTAQLDSQKIRGLVVEKGGQTAHATILARALGIPLLIHVSDATKLIRTGDRLIIDGLAGRVFINPTSAILREYDQLEADLQAHKTDLQGLIKLPTVTRDGVAIKLCANIGKSADAAAAATLNADGIGLYRTEFAFFVQDHLPSEEEQYEIYRSTADRLKPREVVIRVLDIGSDKLLQYFPLPLEANPSLGCRGIRLLLAYPEILRTQLRAIFRLSATHPVSILFPMVGGMEELLAVKAAIESVKASLAVEHQPFNPRVSIGAMIETPSAAILILRLAQEVDFLSIGTNDLVQYLLTADRTSSEVASYYEPLHPAVLQVLASLATAAKAKCKSISVCGEMAGNPAYTKLLLGLGFRSLSVSPSEILEIKNTIRSTHLQQAEDFVRRILQLDTIQEIKQYLRDEKDPMY
ncbi:MAG: phosphoenolpyruvate--protein phosphotransferase [Candidatus Hydrogenedentes bacterium]|nr:phosphoenolpyruvate--protein phosphotransferase [Candidatus Hydrogenedentota bacterium]